MKRAANSELQTTQKKVARKGFKQPPRDLADWIRLANLTKPGQALPDIEPTDQELRWPEILERIAKMDDPLRSELLAWSEPHENWRELYRKDVDLGISISPEYYLEIMRINRVLAHYDRIRTAATHLRMLARTESKSVMDDLEDLVSTLRYAELPYLRQCGVCNEIFYQKRKTQRGCTPNHSTILRKREKYAEKIKQEAYKRDKAKRDKANREYKKR